MSILKFTSLSLLATLLFIVIVYHLQKIDASNNSVKSVNDQFSGSNNLFPFSSEQRQQQRHSSWLWLSPSTNLTTMILSFIAIILLVKDNTICKAISKSIPTTSKRKNLGVAKSHGLFPIRIPIIDGFYNLVKAQRDGVKLFEEMGKTCGKLYELPFGPVTLIVVSDLTVVQKILTSTQPSHLNRPKHFTNILKDIFHEGLFTSEYKDWSPQRKILNRSFTYNSLRHYVVFMNLHAKMLTKKLISVADSNINDEKGSIVGERISEQLYCFAFKTISQIIMGTDSISEARSEEVTRNFNIYKNLIIEKLMNPLSYKHYLWFHPKAKEYKHLNNYISNFIADTTRKYQIEYQQKKKFFEESVGNVGEKPFRCMIEEMICGQLTDTQICHQVATFLGAGHETTVMAIRLFMLNLALNPEQQALCRAEVDELINVKMNSRADNDKNEFSCELSMEELHDLKYLDRCILESGRILSAAPVYLRRLDAPLTISDDLEFPAGTNFAIAPWMIHMCVLNKTSWKDPDQFPNPKKFDPDRFLSENVKKRHSYAYIPFSLGARNCIGWKFALLQIKVTMIWILRNFEIFSTDKIEDVTLLFGVTVVPERTHNIILKRRTQI